jgi:DNA-binding GntR family transcriptional regulator
MVLRHGRLPATELIMAKAQAAPVAICDHLNLPPLARVFRICRARRIDNRLVLYVEHYLNAAYFPGLLAHDLSQPLTELYAREYGILYGQVRFELLPTALPAEAALALRVSTGSPGLRITRVNHDSQGRLIDCDLEYWRHDAIQVVTTVNP